MQQTKNSPKRRGTCIQGRDLEIIASHREIRNRHRPSITSRAYTQSLHANFHIGRAVRLADAATNDGHSNGIDDQLCSAFEAKFRIPIKPVPVHKGVSL